MQRGRRYSTDRMMDALRSEGITTWFDLGLMLDRLRDGRDTPSLIFGDNFDAFTRHIGHGVGLVTFHCAVDGVTAEIAKYAEAMRRDRQPGRPVFEPALWIPGPLPPV